MRQHNYLIKQAWASLKYQPGFVLAVVTTMGLTLGALLSVLTLAYLLLVAPLPYPEQDLLYQVEHQLIDHNGHVDGSAFTYPNLIHLYTEQDVFSHSALMYYDADVLLSVDSYPTLSQSFVTPEWFSMLGVELEIGRIFEQSEALNAYNPVAVLSYKTWKDEFNLDADILSKSLQFGDTSYRIIGVLSESFIEPQLAGVGATSQVFLPWDFNSVPSEQRVRWGNDDSNLMFLGKLANDISGAQVEQELTSLLNQNWQDKVSGSQFFKGWGINLKIQKLQSVILQNSQTTVYLLFAGMVGLLFIASTNIANLFIARTAQQHRNIAIQAAIGASRKQIFNAFFAEAILLMGLSTIIALYFATIGFKIMQRFLSDYLPRVEELSLHYTTLSAAIVLMLSLALVFAYLNVRMINYRALNLSIQSSGKGTSGQISKKTRQGLVLCQIAVVTALVFVNLALLKESIGTINEPLGYETDDISFLVLSLPKVEEAEERVALLGQLRSELLALPKVAGVSQSMAPMPFFTTALSRKGGDERYTAKAKDIDHTYFQLIGQPLLQGNDFSKADIKDRNNVMIVNQEFAQQLSDDGNVLGMTFDNGDAIVGVVKGIKIPGENVVAPRFYYPASLARNMFLIKNHKGNALTRQQVIEAIESVSSELKLFSLDSLNTRRYDRLFSQHVTATTSSVLAVFSFLLAGIGLYGILSYATQMRRFELGTRLAIGAKRKQLIGLVIKDNAWVIAIGMTTSVVVMLVLYIAYKEQLSAYIGTELLGMFALTICAIGSLSLFACYWPLRQYINRPAIHSLRGSD